MNEIIRMTKPQLNKANALIRRHCCNCVDSNCILLDDGEPCLCPQMLTYSLICNWFRSAVLPDSPALQNEIVLRKGEKLCTVCGRGFVPASNRAKYCPDCAKTVRRRKEAARVKAKYYARKSANPRFPCMTLHFENFIKTELQKESQ